jgi:putative membrane protein
MPPPPAGPTWPVAPPAPPIATPPIAAPAPGGAAEALSATTAWRRLHPLSPLVRAGRSLTALIVLGLEAVGTSGNRSPGLVRLVIDLCLVALVALLGVVSWLVTRWRLDGSNLRINTGLVRRQAQQFPLVQIQAVDVLEPFVARIFGLAEVRLRMAGTSTSAGRLAYLRHPEALALQAQLLALAHGLGADEPAPAGHVLATVHPGRLVASLLLDTPTVAFVVLAACAVVIESVTGAAVVQATIPTLGAFLVALVTGWARRFNAGYGLTLTEAPDGWRLQSGLTSRSSETIPRGRVQAARIVTPPLWRPWGWSRLELDVAGRAQRERNSSRNQRRAVRIVLPVGPHQQCRWLLERVFPGAMDPSAPPPPRARWKSPLAYHWLAWAGNDRYVTTRGGRIRQEVQWVPLTKVQSLRLVEGPVQRRLRLASVHVDTAGRSLHAELRDRDRAEADRLLTLLSERCRSARREEHQAQLLARAGRGPSVGSKGPLGSSLDRR